MHDMWHAASYACVFLVVLHVGLTTCNNTRNFNHTSCEFMYMLLTGENDVGCALYVGQFGALCHFVFYSLVTEATAGFSGLNWVLDTN